MTSLKSLVSSGRSSMLAINPFKFGLPVGCVWRVSKDLKELARQVSHYSVSRCSYTPKQKPLHHSGQLCTSSLAGLFTCSSGFGPHFVESV
ncbi:unnamed protein product [Polarella glacialis]|uniref:Uncharacterized protein n=1 Tax=Polarella glacialis TaxID=89957 RepID=A0A813DFM4_POLGL|nr:unnamed protein product [Polarella glacialis]